MPARPPTPPSPPEGLPLGRTLLYVVLVCVLGTWAYLSFAGKPGALKASIDRLRWSLADQGELLEVQRCASTDTPPHGARQGQATLQDTTVTLLARNGTAGPLQLTVSAGAAGSSGPITVHEGRSVVLQVPAQAFELSVEAGQSWCDGRLLDARTTVINSRQPLPPGASGDLWLTQNGEAVAGQLNLSPQLERSDSTSPFDWEPPAAAPGTTPVAQAGDTLRLTLFAEPSGHHLLRARAGDEGLVFMVDTGATLTAVPAGFAERAGLPPCEVRGYAQTANGKVPSCVTRIPSLQMGPFLVKDVEVAVLPGLGAQGLLGQNVLRRFAMTQEGGKLTLRVGER